MIKKTIGIIPRNLIKNKKRTFSIAISIILSIALITSIEILFNSIIKADIRQSQALSGDYYASYLKIHYNSVKKLMQDDRMIKTGITSFLGNANIDDKIILLNGMDDGAAAMLGMNLIEGKYPKEDKEIVADKRFLNEFFPKAEIGDTLKLVFDIEEYDQITHEIIINKSNFEFILCGVIDDLGGIYSVGKGSIFLNEAGVEKIVPPEKMTYNLFFTTSMNCPIKETVEWFNSKYGDDYKKNYQINYNRVNTMDTYQKSKKIIVIIDIIVALACSILIYNLINISVAERIKQFGLLKSIGITPIQIKIILVGETLLLGLVLIPIGIALGVNITDLFISIIGEVEDVKLYVDSSCYNVISITSAGIFSLLLASYKPARVVSKISVLEAIKDNKNGLKRSKSFGGFLNQTINTNRGYMWKMTYMNLIRNRKRFAATTISIAICVMVFLSINYSINAINPLNAAKLDNDSDFILSINVSYKNLGFEDREVKEIENIKGIKNIKKYRYLKANSKLSEKNMTGTGIEFVKSQDNISVKQSTDDGVYVVFVYLVGCSKEQMDEINGKLLKSNREDVSNGTYPAAFVFQDKNKKELVSFNPGEKINISWTTVRNGNKVDIKGGFIVESAINEMPFKITTQDSGIILLTEEENISKLFGLKGYQKINIYIDKHGDVKEIENKLRDISSRVEDAKLDSYNENIKMIKELKGDILIILYLLLSMIVAFALVNVTNTISMNIITRRQEFGMLRAIGFFPKLVESEPFFKPQQLFT